MKDIKELEKKARELKEMVVRMTTKAGTGHVTSSFSCAELMTALYYGDILRYRPDDCKWEGRDYFILSKGHANPILYAILADLGFIDKKELDLFCQPGGKIGVLLRGDIPGAEITSGSLGCGLVIAAGIAQALKSDRKPNYVFCMLGDAECREGAVWESAMYIGYAQLNNLVTIIDRNYLGATHFVEEEAGIEPIDDKWEAFGFDVRHINGHDIGEIMEAVGDVRCIKSKKPLAIIADTVKGNGVSFIENIPFMHGVAVKPERMEEAIEEIGKGSKL